MACRTLEDVAGQTGDDTGYGSVDGGGVDQFAQDIGGGVVHELGSSKVEDYHLMLGNIRTGNPHYFSSRCDRDPVGQCYYARPCLEGIGGFVDVFHVQDALVQQRHGD